MNNSVLALKKGFSIVLKRLDSVLVFFLFVVGFAWRKPAKVIGKANILVNWEILMLLSFEVYF